MLIYIHLKTLRCKLKSYNYTSFISFAIKCELTERLNCNTKEIERSFIKIKIKINIERCNSCNKNEGLKYQIQNTSSSSKETLIQNSYTPI